MDNIVVETNRLAPSYDTPKRVIVFAPLILPWSETFIREQVRAMRRWKPILVGERIVENGLPLDGLNIRLLTPRQKSKLYRWSYVACRLLRIAHPPSVKMLRSLGASLIHAHFGTTAVDIWPLARALGLPMIVTLHGFDINIYREWWESGNGGWHRRHYPQQLLRLAAEPNTRFIAVSKAIRNRAITFGIPIDKITVRYIGVDTAKFHPADIPITQRPKRILFVGRLVEKKGTEYLIRAFARVRSHIPDAELVIAGDGPLRKMLEQLVVTLKIPVHFLGTVQSDEVIKQMHQARFFCLPSVTAKNGDAEGFGMVLLEAQSCGLPVVSSALGGADEGLINKHTGLRAAEKNIEALTDQLSQMLTDNDLCNFLSENAPRFIQRCYSIENCSRALEQSYDSIV